MKARQIESWQWQILHLYVPLTCNAMHLENCFEYKAHSSTVDVLPMILTKNSLNINLQLQNTCLDRNMPWTICCWHVLVLATTIKCDHRSSSNAWHLLTRNAKVSAMSKRYLQMFCMWTHWKLLLYLFCHISTAAI